MGVKRPGDTRKAIHASQLIMKKAVSKSPQGLTTRYLVETQKLGKDGKPLASVVVSVRKISQETQRETKRAGRFIVSTGAKTDAKVRRRQGLPPAFISAQE
jgi:hypothetical protein